MHIKSLELVNFRNYSNVILEPINGLNILVGENAQGKTNIVESIYFTSSLKSYRTFKDRELIKWGFEKAYIKEDIEKQNSFNKIEVLINNEDKKAVRINGVKNLKPSDAIGMVNVVIFSPEDLKLLKEGPAIRRKFIDNELNQLRPKYHHALLQYNHILLNRNNLLKLSFNKPSLKTEIEVFSEQLAEYGSFIVEARYEFIKKLSMIARLIHRKITNGEEEIEITYQCDAGLFNSKSQVKKELLNFYINQIDKDIEKGYTLKGPHRDDIIIRINGTDARIYGSQGQQRSAALSLKLSEIEIIKSEVGEYPILLLDDVMSELDINRQKHLLNTFKNIQTFLTCTTLNDINAFHFDNKSIFTVKQGTVKKQ
ncbi:DNA replication and repair protein RecF [Caloramator quimbayensis]|uniref:DNA replication and repair protein RecF n=1 Tax=Caloramator quimbayensis TaxID=1147123 RepID=A0A1T4Y6L7_9CLOT|nr:DNA replication/repair protein RecF [Caloramator quimbayensis]SKA97429.1 DNA replication and repair protein RecF [Caloramator quimbayensis]